MFAILPSTYILPTPDSEASIPFETQQLQHLEMERHPLHTPSLATMTPHLLTPPSHEGLSTIPPFPCSPSPLVAPPSNTEFSSSIPAKRGPEDDVQFVSSHLVVKKGRTGLEPAPAQEQQPSEQSNALSHGQSAIIQPPQDLQGLSFGGSLMSAPVLGRRASIAGLENYVFPQPLNSTTSQTSRSSPMLSPKQLPRSVLLETADKMAQPTAGTPTPPSTSLQHGSLQIPWGMASLYPQPASTPAHTAWNPQLSLPPVQAQRNEQPPSVPERAPSQPPPVRARTPEGLNPTSILPPGSSYSRAKEPSPQPAERIHDSPSTQPGSIPPPQPDPKAANEVPAQTASSNDHSSNNVQSPTIPTANYANHTATIVTNAQPQVSKPPCLICEQMRQQAFLNQATGLPAGHHLHLQQQGWQGLSPFQQQLHLANPSTTAPGMGLQNYQFRYQPFHAGQYPVGFAIPQVQVPVQMPVQRVAQVVNLNPEEQWQGERPQNGQSQINSQSPLALATTNQATPGPLQVPQSGRQTYLQGSAPPPQPSLVTARPNIVVQQSAMPATLAHPSSAVLPSTAVQQPQLPLIAQSPKTTTTQPEPRKHSPNLIVDIAETCEDVFPWDEVAQRHGVPRAKIVETFSAIIQLPLLRCTTDKKRHGKLATSRLREYTKAKKDVEAAAAKGAATTSAAAITATTKAPSTESAAPNKSSPSQSSPLRPSQSNAESHLQTAETAYTGFKPPILPSVLEMANTMAPLGLPSTLSSSLPGQWQQQRQQQHHQQQQ